MCAQRPAFAQIFRRKIVYMLTIMVNPGLALAL